MEMSKDEIRDQIIEAFQDNVYPGDSRLVSLDPMVMGEHQEYYERIQGRTWRELLNELDSLEGPSLYYFSAIFSFLTVEAFLYYFPAFLITAIDPDRSDTVSDCFFFCLDPSGNYEYHTKVAKHVIEKLNDDQKKVVRTAVAYLYEQNPDDLYGSLCESWSRR